MDPIAILSIIDKGVIVIGALVEAGQTAAPAISATLKAIRDLISGAKAGTTTQTDLDATETLLDQQIADFNLEIE